MTDDNLQPAGSEFESLPGVPVSGTDRLDEIRARADAATGGPWEVRKSRSGNNWIDGRNYDEILAPETVECMAYCYGGSSMIRLDDMDAAFIAAARDDVPWLLAEVARVARERDALAATMERVRALHTPKRDEPWSLVQHEFCSCGAMETYTADDGYPAIGPAHYPCPTVRALDGERTATPGDPLLEVDAASYGPDSVPLAALDAPAGATDDDGSE